VLELPAVHKRAGYLRLSGKTKRMARATMNAMWPLAVVALSSVAACSQTATRTPTQPVEPFTRMQLTSAFYAEGIAAGDFDRDGALDLTAGPFWWAGPTFTVRAEIRPPRSYPIGMYSDCFLVFVDDLDRDGWQDILHVGFPGQDAGWYAHPTVPGVHWTRHAIAPQLGLESPAYVDLDGDGRRDLIGVVDTVLVWLSPDPADVRRPWLRRRISSLPAFGQFTHGLGVADLNGDGRLDVVTAIGWFEQPPALQGDPDWTPHAVSFGGGQGGAQMICDDVDGDGDIDVVTSINAHAYGLSWFEHVRNGGQIAFVEHVIQRAVRDPGDPHQFSQPHALAWADVDGDGLADLITGKRFWAHNGADPGERDPAVLYWFKRERAPAVRFTPQLVDNDLGVGLQVLAADLNGDARTDFAVANKKGTAVLLQHR
jgi:hypothetical protein